MRLSEKSIELNFASQCPIRAGHPMIWIGLTQAQEALAGFDVCTRLGGRMILLQFKASNIVLRNRSRKFSANHDQMQNLLRTTAQLGCDGYYVFPSIGTMQEFLHIGFDLIPYCYFLDVNQIPALAPPGRASNCHNVYLHTLPGRPFVEIRSDPVKAPLVDSKEFLRQIRRTGNSLDKKDRKRFEKYLKTESAKRVMAVFILPG